jgi:diguanylate cyclase (GGDEF)-like protein
MVTGVIAACAVLGTCGLMLLALRRARVRTDRRLDAILRQVDAHLEGMSTSVARAVDAAVASGGQRRLPTPTLDFDELVDSIVVEAVERTRADAVVLRIEGPGGRPVIASSGAGAGSETLDRSFGPPGARRFDAAMIDWTYAASGDPQDAEFQSALVVPLVETTEIPGTLAAYALAPDAFRPEHASAVRSLLRDTAVALANARRFAEIEARVNVDPLTGSPNRRGYEIELGREIARAQRAGRPLSVVLVAVGSRPGTQTTEGAGIGEVARLVARMTRGTDIACRRGERELAILLPGTEATGAAVLTTRLETEAKRTHTAGTPAMTFGLVERQPNESPEALDARIDQAWDRPRSATVSALDEARNSSTAVASTLRSSLASSADLVRVPPEDALRRDALDALTRELDETRRFGRALAVVALEVDGLDDVSERHGREEADATLSQLAGRFDRSLGTGSVHRLGVTAFALVLPGSSTHESEALVDALQSSLEPPHAADGLVLSAGITELTDGDDAETGLARAEHALWQARQAGPGTVVVAVPNKRPVPPP